VGFAACSPLRICSLGNTPAKRILCSHRNPALNEAHRQSKNCSWLSGHSCALPAGRLGRTAEASRAQESVCDEQPRSEAQKKGLRCCVTESQALFKRRRKFEKSTPISQSQQNVLTISCCRPATGPYSSAGDCSYQMSWRDNERGSAQMKLSLDQRIVISLLVFLVICLLIFWLLLDKPVQTPDNQNLHLRTSELRTYFPRLLSNVCRTET
jgi:hypothetical protein